MGLVAGTTFILTGAGTLMGAFSQIPTHPEGLRAFWTRGLSLIALGAAAIVLSAGLLEGRRWAWVGAVVLAGLGLIRFPIGTVVGVAALVYLLSSGVRDFFRPVPHTPVSGGPERPPGGTD